MTTADQSWLANLAHLTPLQRNQYLELMQRIERVQNRIVFERRQVEQLQTQVAAFQTQHSSESESSLAELCRYLDHQKNVIAQHETELVYWQGKLDVLLGRSHQHDDAASSAVKVAGNSQHSARPDLALMLMVSPVGRVGS
jgi:predicted RNase H-like nuclease (RuvC/YqgF family)